MPGKISMDKQLSTQSQHDGTYNDMMLTYPLSVTGLAGVLAAPADDVRAELADLAVQVRE
jgi:hypothetical protein